MTKVSKFATHTRIRLGVSLSLIFFVLTLLFSCVQDEHEGLAIVWTNNRATAISISKSLLKGHSTDSAGKFLQVRLSGKSAAMLGEYENEPRRILFTPIIPLSRGSRYEILFRDKLIGNIGVPADTTATAPKLLVIYPTSDSVPENLLKLYFAFSAPMREGEALQHIFLLNDQNDTLPGVFLDLQPELWNKERTVLTLWLDPGRIKRDLIPNRTMGNPLRSGQRNRLIISADWKDMQGLSLQQPYHRDFMVGPRDSISPQINSWAITAPEPGTRKPLRVITGEPLDYFLLQETIGIFDDNRKKVSGAIKVFDKERAFNFVPDKTWPPGRYYLQVASKLEDLAGNNLNRLFDRDIFKPKLTMDKSSAEREFVIGAK